MNKYYSSEKNVQILISLLKASNIKKVVVSPGTANASFIGSIQNDSFFEIYSCVDERSACYMACGLAAESDEPVIISCTGATASRNYMPGLTEAYYRKLPILAITSMLHQGKVGNNIPQTLDRTQTLNDIVKLSVQLPSVYSQDDEWSCIVAINKAILELKHHGNGPVHINLITDYSFCFDVKELPVVRKIDRIEYSDKIPSLEKSKIGIFVGAHAKWNDELLKSVDEFCEKYNAVVICDHTSNYNGKYKVLANIVCDQENYDSPLNSFELLIHIGDVSGSYLKLNVKEVWRINPDGEIRDTFQKLKYVFEMKEIDFFTKYNNLVKNNKCIDFYNKWKKEYEEFKNKAMECSLPFSNIWAARTTIRLLPDESVLHLAILNSLRSWNLFDTDKKIYCYTNTGGFGIDGMISTLLGASLNNTNKNYYGVIGDLGFFYDMNTLGNRNFGSNVRIMLINNGGGAEFHIYSHQIASFGDDVGKYMAADGHFGKKSKKVVKHLAEDFGFEYISAENKEDFLDKIDYFISPKKYEKPIIFEIFTNSKDESDALKIMHNLKTSASSKAKNTIKKVLSPRAKQTIKKIIGK